MDYFSPRTPEVGPGHQLGHPLQSGSAQDSYFGSSNTTTALGRHKSISPEQNSFNSSSSQAAFGAATAMANPFKLSNPHPTAFPVQNGATMQFQQALLQRRAQGHAPFTSSVSSFGPNQQPPLPTPLLHQQHQQHQQHHQHSDGLPNSLPLARGASSPGRVQKRHHHPPSHITMTHKSVRTPVISSPRKLETHSPTSSDSAASSGGSPPVQTSAGAAIAGLPLLDSSAYPVPSLAVSSSSSSSPSSRNNVNVQQQQQQPHSHHSNTSSQFPASPKLGLPSKAAALSQQPPSRASSLPFPISATSLHFHESSPVRNGSYGTAGASITATTMRRGSAVSNTRFRTLSVQEGLAFLHSISNIMKKSSLTSSSSSSFPHSESATSTPSTLVLDLRPHTAFVAQGRIRGSINVCVPSTLLRRPNFGLAKIAETLTTKRDRALFARALNLDAPGDGDGQMERIIVLDQESSFLSTDCALHSLLAKLDRQGFKGELGWCKGGFSALEKSLEEQNGDHLSEGIDWSTLSETEEEEDENDEESEGQDENMGRAQTDGIDFALPLPSQQQFSTSTSSSGILPGRPSSSSASSGSLTSGSYSDSLQPSSLASSNSSIIDETIHPHFTAGTGFDHRALSLPQIRPSKLSLNDENDASSTTYGRLGTGSVGAPTSAKPLGKSLSTPIIRPKNLPMSAFQFGSTAAYSAITTDGAPTETITPSSSSSAAALSLATTATRSKPGSRSRSPVLGLRNLPGSNPIQSEASMHQNGLKGGMRSGGGYGTGGSSKYKQAANPFFDNIRQNIEVQSLESVLAHVAPMHIPETFTSAKIAAHMPTFLQNLIELSPSSRAEKVHKEYFAIEQSEQKRLQKVLDWHCSQSVGPVLDKSLDGEGGEGVKGKKDKDKTKDKDKELEQELDEGYHPFSISAGVEKGHLNRYKNMWPYEHARVRLLSTPSPTSGDYINASHIRLRGTTKHYIASQGPLEGTAEHFWQLVLQENVSTIVMLTLLSEGGREKCYNYFQTKEYPSVSVVLKEEQGDAEAMKKSTSVNLGFFGMADAIVSPPLFKPEDNRTTNNDDSSHDEGESSFKRQFSISKGPNQLKKMIRSSQHDAATLRRTIEVRNKKTSIDNRKPPLIVTHIQYICWPDFDIPPEPEGVIHLISETAKAQEGAIVQNAPVLVHCSAGVGRTGTFIAVDTLLERYRCERAQAASKREQSDHHPNQSQGQQLDEDTTSTARSFVMDVDRQTESPAIIGVPSASEPLVRHQRTSSTTSNSDTMQAMNLDSDTNIDIDSNTHLHHHHHHRPSPSPSMTTTTKNVNDTTTNTTAALCTHLKQKELIPEDYSDPIKSLVDQMREQRMSSVANPGQYVFTYLALMAGITAQLKEEGVVDLGE